MKKIHLFPWVLALPMLFSCSKDEIPQYQNNDPVAVAADSAVVLKNKLLTDYAKVLAQAVRQKELRSIVKNQVMLKFDGDYEVLVNRLESVKMAEKGGSVRDLLSKLGSNSALRSQGVVPLDSDYLSIAEVMPNVQVAVPVHCEEWDPDTYVPLVAVLPFDYQEKPGNIIKAYDAEGKEYSLNADEEPSFPVVVVGRSERVDEHGQLLTDQCGYSTPQIPKLRALNIAPEYPVNLLLTHGAARSLLLEWTDVVNDIGYEIWRMSGTVFQKVAQTSINDNSFVDAGLTANQKYWYKVRAITADGYSSWSPVMATTASNRNDNEWLKIKRMKFSSSALKAVEGWISGAPEIRLRVVQGSESGATNVFTSGMLEPTHRSDICDTWWNREITIFAWSTNVYGTVLAFDWREEDWLENVDFPLTGSYEDKQSGGTVKVGGSIQIKNDPGGDVIGNTSVMWWQEKSQIYDLSGFQWQFVY